MKKDRDQVYLLHIKQSIFQIKKYLKGATLGALQNDDMLTDALARQLSIIGEATNNFSPEFKKRNADIPYRDMISMRNFLIHKYAKVDRKTVWETCKNDITSLEETIDEILKQESSKK